MDDLTEQVLVRSARSGDMSAFERLMKEHEPGVRAFFRVRVFDWSAADDLAQDVFVTAFKRIGTYRGESRFGVWLRGIAANHLRNWIRRRRDEPVGGGEEMQALFTEQIDLHYGQDGNPADFEPDETVLLAALDRCVKKLDGPSREILDARYQHGKSVREIAAGTARGYSALVMQLLRIRKVLANCIRSQFERPHG